MKPIDIYQAPILEETTELHHIRYFLEGIDISNESFDNQNRVLTRIHYNPYIDGSRHAELLSVWWKSPGGLHPVFICKTGGRPDYEHYARFITNKQLFCEMISYLKSLELQQSKDIVDINVDIDNLNEVYGNNITHLFKTNNE